MKILLLAVLLASCAPRYPLSCLYVARAPQAGPEAHAGCARGSAQDLQMADTHLQQLDFDSRGLAAVRIAGQWLYFQRDGRHAAVLDYDNGADAFAEGLVRSPRDGRVAYLDEQLQEVIPPRYDWGWPFTAGRALVCLGCRLGAPDADGHRTLQGGRWGYIDHSGRELVPVIHPAHAVPRQ